MRADGEWARLIREMLERQKERENLLGWYLERKKELGDLDEF